MKPLPDVIRWHKLNGPDGSDWWGSQHGGVSLQLDLDERTCEVHLSAGGEATPGDIEQAINQLACTGLVFPNEFTCRYADSGVLHFSARF